MSSFSHAFWIWIPVLLYKMLAAIFMGIWKFNLWIIQSISGTPIYYSEPQYRIPGLIAGTLGNLLLLNVFIATMTLGSVSTATQSPYYTGSDILLLLLVSAILLVVARVVIRKGV